MMKQHNILLAICAAVLLVVMPRLAHSAEYLVKDQAAYSERVKSLQPGDHLVLANGVWRDFEILFTGVGTAEAPIFLRGQEPGKVIISGRSNLRIAGEHLEVSDLVFRDGYTPSSAVIAFRKNKEALANHSRVTRVVVDRFNNPQRRETDYWVALYGKHNRFDHNHLEGKFNRGVTMAVRLDSEASRENHHRIDHNYFGPRPVFGSNGGETLRIGTSHYSLSDSYTVIENNYFDRCDGEVEIISNKSGGNIFRGNVFFESRGTLTLRHGNGNLVENNAFFGNGVDHTGGIRVINAKQTVRNNYMEGLTGYRFGGGLVVMNGVPDSPINRYHQVADTVIEHNSLINVDHIQLAAGSDVERSAVPVRSRMANNLIYHARSSDTFTVYDDISGIAFSDNLTNAKTAADIGGLEVDSSLSLQRAANGLMYPDTESEQTAGVSADLTPIARSRTGVDWYPKASKPTEFGSGTTTEIDPGYTSLQQAVANAGDGDIIKLTPGDYTVDRVLTINKVISIAASGSGSTSDTDSKPRIFFERSALFEIQEGGSLLLDGVEISGRASPDSTANTVIRTQRGAMLENYRLVVRRSLVSDLDINHSFSFLSAAKGTMADMVEITDSHFANIDGPVLKLDAENDDQGVFNADYVTIKDSHFESVTGALVDLYRGGTDESTFGPHFELTGSRLENVGHGKRNKNGGSAYLHGVQVSTVRDNVFLDSAPLQVRHTVAEPITRIRDNQFCGTGSPVLKELNRSDDGGAVIEFNACADMK